MMVETMLMIEPMWAAVPEDPAKKPWTPSETSWTAVPTLVTLSRTVPVTVWRKAL